MRRSESDVSGFFADLYGWVGSATFGVSMSIASSMVMRSVAVMAVTFGWSRSVRSMGPNPVRSQSGDSFGKALVMFPMAVHTGSLWRAMNPSPRFAAA